MNKRLIVSIVGGLVAMLPYQNCSQQYDLGAKGRDASSILTIAPNSSNPTVTTQIVPPPGSVASPRRAPRSKMGPGGTIIIGANRSGRSCCGI